MTLGATSTISAAALLRLATSLLEAADTPSDLAHIVAEALVDANLAGHDSHGVMRLPTYVRLVRAGKVKPAARPAVAGRQQAMATVDGHWGWGQPAARLATETAIALATEYGIGAVTIHRCNHIGRIGEYVEIMARAGMTGMVLCNAGPAVVPHGGRERRLGTNPFAWAAPTADPERPLMLDFATSAVAEGKLQVAQAKEQQIAPGLIVDAQGRPTTSLDDFYAGGALLPFGGHKGYGLSVMVEILGGALSGSAPSSLPEYGGGNGTLLIALDIATFQPLERFVDQSSQFAATIKDTQPAPAFDEVLLPGEPEARSRQQRAANGIPLPEQTWSELHDLAAQLGLSIEEERA
ncbi:MAG TPA: Ldh family oxidoreductase [Chloroflexota bacterium]|nr:Ldh family oxidoreductase [Chloroflexota bacterium]